METTPTPPDADTRDALLGQALDHYRAARWDDALQCLDTLAADGPLDASLEELREDVRIKQTYERLPLGALATPRRTRTIGAGPIWIGGAVALIAMIAGLAVVSLVPSTGAAPATPQAAIIGALPTPAPTNTPEPTPPPPVGNLSVEAAAGASLSRTADNIYLIFDASGSMLAPLGDRPRIDIAHEAVGRLVEVLPADAQVALRTYGRNRPDDCADVELVSPLVPLDRAALAAQVNGIVPVNLGRTPIARSLDQVPADLANADGDTLVVLLSDGEENCDGDPTAAAARLHAENPRLRVSVIGFAVDATQQEQLAAVARAGGGSFFAAADVDQLEGALREAVVPVVRVLDPAGAEVARAEIGDMFSLDPGSYRVEVGEVAPIVLDTVEVRGGLHTVVELRDENGELRASVREP